MTVHIPNVPKINFVIWEIELNYINEIAIAISVCKGVIGNIKNPINGRCDFGNANNVHIGFQFVKKALPTLRKELQIFFFGGCELLLVADYFLASLFCTLLRLKIWPKRTFTVAF